MNIHTSIDLGETSTHVVVLASVLVPIAIAVALWVKHPPGHRRRGAIALATTWNAVGLLALNVIAQRVGWWEFGEAGPSLLGVPVALWLGWVVLWGTAGAQSPVRPATTVAALAVFDLIYMPLAGDAVLLHNSWLLGEAVALAAIAWPGLLLARWAEADTRLAARASLQLAMFGVMLFWAIPALAIGGLDRPMTLEVPPPFFGVAFGALILATLPGLISLHEFHLAGGTPWPWDSTTHAVRSGPYRYVRSPMQLSGVLVLVIAATLYREPVVLAAAVSAVGYSRLFSALEQDELIDRFGDDWALLANGQRRWLPTWRPSAHAEPATIWIGFSCEVCDPIARFLAARRPVGLDIRDAASHPDVLFRARYERADGVELDGVRAVGAALEHLHLAWAFAGWLLRLPVAWRWWQLIGDAVGFGPRPSRPIAPATPMSSSPA
ncbi:MAG: methyltransferase family protein [Acidimicrobiales bacterium]